MELSKREGLLQRLIRESAEGHAFLFVCMMLSLGGTVSAAYPVTAVVVPAALLVPPRWRQITGVTALGSALGATLLVIVFHHLGWTQLYERFPELSTHATWIKVMAWVSDYGAAALFLIAISPLPQTPALIIFGITSHDYLIIFIAMLAGKTLKYGVFAWTATRFPERYSNGIAGFFRFRRQTNADHGDK
jgi:membrane protein YqaA with SNARE-associated domain